MKNEKYRYLKDEHAEEMLYDLSGEHGNNENEYYQEGGDNNDYVDSDHDHEDHELNDNEDHNDHGGHDENDLLDNDIHNDHDDYNSRHEDDGAQIDINKEIIIKRESKMKNEPVPERKSEYLNLNKNLTFRQ